MRDAIPRRQLGRTGLEVSAIGVGGYHLGLVKEEKTAIRIVQECMDAGVNFLDNAWEYHDGATETLMGKAIAGRRHEVVLMTKVCTHGRGREVAMEQLEDSLRRLRTDYLDVWQVHEVIYDNDPELGFARGGVIEALEQAKREGKVRFTGFTGHKDPAIHLKMLAYPYAFDTCQFPLNCFDGQFRSFEQSVLPEVNRRGMAAIGMKAMGGDGDAVKRGVVRPQEALRYVMSLPVAVTVSGMDSLSVMEQNLDVACGFRPYSPEEMRTLRERVAAQAADGRFELYKTSKLHDGPPGREQHGFPSRAEVDM